MTEKEKFIIFLDNETPQKSDAIVLLEGDGFARCNKAIQLYKDGFAKRIIFSGNADYPSYGSYPFSKIKPYLLEKGIPENALIWEKRSTNTYEQGIEILKLVKQNGWNKIIIVASQYHSYRAMLTFISVLNKEQSSLVVFNGAVKDLLWEEQLEYGKRIDFLEAEFSRIEQYQKKGDVASFEEGVKYQLWKQALTKRK